MSTGEINKNPFSYDVRTFPKHHRSSKMKVRLYVNLLKFCSQFATVSLLPNLTLVIHYITKSAYSLHTHCVAIFVKLLQHLDEIHLFVMISRKSCSDCCGSSLRWLSQTGQPSGRSCSSRVCIQAVLGLPRRTQT